jgi:hypothetical protein
MRHLHGLLSPFESVHANRASSECPRFFSEQIDEAIGPEEEDEDSEEEEDDFREESDEEPEEEE